jgi:archaemetzincin
MGRIFAIAFLNLLTFGSVQADPPEKQMLPAQFCRLLPLHKKLAAPKPDEWLAEHPEAGQTFRQYLKAEPIRAEKKRRVLYLQPIGDFSPSQSRILDITTEFMTVYFQLPVKRRDVLSLDAVPASARRKPNGIRSEQILTTYVLSKMLRPRLPSDAVAMIAFTASDLWPGEGWNYVFGQAAFSDRVGIWSVNRFGDSDRDEEAFRRCLLRTLKTASHETGHMFSIQHCTLYDCNMCGSNHLPEADRRPLEVCPHCLAKLCYATGANPVKRFERLIAFYRAQNLKAEQEFCEKSLAAMRK